jgi:hypothetical protein
VSDKIATEQRALEQFLAKPLADGPSTVDELLARLLTENRRMAEQVQELQTRGTRFMLEEQEFRIVLRRVAEAREPRESVASLALAAADVLARCPR